MAAQVGSFESVTLVVAEARPLLRHGLEHICSEAPGFEVVAACADAEATLEALRLRKPDVLILNIELPPHSGLPVLRQMRRENLPTRTVLLASRPDDRRALQAMRHGVGGILPLDMTPETLLRCIRTVHAGELWLESRALGQLVDRRPRAGVGFRQLGAGLTPRQREIVQLVTEALPTREIAARLMVTEGTVKVHLHKIYAKLHVEGRVGLVLRVMK
jgi:two-component system nitrate/nitrite response regulator NarL